MKQPKQTGKQPAKFATAEQIWREIPQVQHIRKEFPAWTAVVVVPDTFGSSLPLCSCGRGTPQGSPLSPFLFAVAMDRLTDEVRQDSVGVLKVICVKSRALVETPPPPQRGGGVPRRGVQDSCLRQEAERDAELLFRSHEDAEAQEGVQTQGHVPWSAGQTELVWTCPEEDT